MSFSLSDDELNLLYENSTFRALVESVESSNARFRDLPKAQKYLAASLVSNGKLEIIPDLWRLFYRRRIPSIKEFLSPEYVGDNALFYPSNPGDIGYVWRKELEEIFAPESSCYFLVATGAIGTAKTSACAMAHFYNLFRVTSLRYPQMSLGSAPSKPMNLQLMSVTTDKAYETVMIPMLNLLRSSNGYFYEVESEKNFNEVMSESDGKVIPFFLKEQIIRFPENIKVVCGARDYHALGDDLFGIVLDEAEVRITQKGAEATIDLFFQMVERIRSRFLGSKYIFASLISSIGEESGVISKMIKSIKPDDPHRRIARFSIWDVRFPNEMGKGSFLALRGTRSFPSKVLTDLETEDYENGKFNVPVGCRIIRVPNTYRFEFDLSPNRALRNLAGVETTAEDHPFGRIEEAVDTALQPEILLRLDVGDKKNIIDLLPVEMFITTPDGRRLRRFPHAYRYIHVDLAATGAAGITMLHKERSKLNDIYYVVDFCLRIETTTYIPYESITTFLLDLRRVLSVGIHSITSDQFQSQSMLQYCHTRNLAKIVRILSVDRTLDPYSSLLEIVNEGCLKIGTSPTLMDELKSIYFSGDKPFADARKDQADSLAGAAYSAMLNVMDIPSSVYDHDFVRGVNLVPKSYVEMVA